MVAVSSFTFSLSKPHNKRLHLVLKNHHLCITQVSFPVVTYHAYASGIWHYVLVKSPRVTPLQHKFGRVSMLWCDLRVELIIARHLPTKSGKQWVDHNA
jgi:hypothetical protein